MTVPRPRDLKGGTVRFSRDYDALTSFADAGPRHGESFYVPGEELLRALTEIVGVAVWVLGQKGEVLFVAPSIEPARGLSLAALFERSGCWIDRVHSQDRESVLAFADSVRNGADDLQIEYRLLDPDGRTCWFQTRVVRVLDELEGLVTVGVTRDVTATRVAAGVAHDSRNLLMVIHWAARLLLDRKSEGSRDLTELELIERSVEKARGLTRQLEAPGQPPEPRPEVVDPNALIEGMEPVLRSVLGRNVDLACSFDPRIRRVRVDRAQMERVLLNLVANAREAMDAGGRIEIVTRNFARSFHDREAAPSSPLVELIVRDDGVGMIPEVRRRVLEPHFTTKRTGSGLGLSIVDDIVRGNGGCVHVASARGAGTTITIHLPALADALVGEIPRRGPAAASRQRTPGLRR
jgi:PAS domain S-box-containing protein